jgi:hypothetical protein
MLYIGFVSLVLHCLRHRIVHEFPIQVWLGLVVLLKPVLLLEGLGSA